MERQAAREREILTVFFFFKYSAHHCVFLPFHTYYGTIFGVHTVLVVSVTSLITAVKYGKI